MNAKTRVNILSTHRQYLTNQKSKLIPQQDKCSSQVLIRNSSVYSNRLVGLRLTRKILLSILASPFYGFINILPNLGIILISNIDVKFESLNWRRKSADFISYLLYWINPEGIPFCLRTTKKAFHNNNNKWNKCTIKQ